MFEAVVCPISALTHSVVPVSDGCRELNGAHEIAGPISESDFFTWEALIMGPKDTPFEGGVFPAKLTFVRGLRFGSNDYSNLTASTAFGLSALAVQDEVRAADLPHEQSVAPLRTACGAIC